VLTIICGADYAKSFPLVNTGILPPFTWIALAWCVRAKPTRAIRMGKIVAIYNLIGMAVCIIDASRPAFIPTIHRSPDVVIREKPGLLFKFFLAA